MDKINKISEFLGKQIAIIVLLTALFSLLFPSNFLWIKTSYINYLLMIIMFGMGLTLKSNDFILVFSHPREIIWGVFSQYLIMSFLALGLSFLFHLDSALTAGVILVGTCPGGTASNVITYLSKGDVALSVCMTSVNTLLSPVLTPLITYLMLKTTVETNIWAMFFGIINVILVPIILGIICNKFFSDFTKKITKILPAISVVAISLVIASVVSHNSKMILSAGSIILLIVVFHNILGFIIGFFIGKLLKLNNAKIKAFSIEIGMQNSGLASSLANTTFPLTPEAAVPGAIFSVWHNISGSILASIYRCWDGKNEDNIKAKILKVVMYSKTCFGSFLILVNLILFVFFGCAAPSYFGMLISIAVISIITFMVFRLHCNVIQKESMSEKEKNKNFFPLSVGILFIILLAVNIFYYIFATYTGGGSMNVMVAVIPITIFIFISYLIYSALYFLFKSSE